MKNVVDIKNLIAELDADDLELMQMFPVGRKIVLDNMLMVTDGESCYLISKDVIACRKKLQQDIFDAATTGVAVVILLIQTILMLKRLVSPLRCMPAMTLILFAFMMLRMVVKHFRRSRRIRR